MLGRDGAVLYVGTSRALRTRLLSYFRAVGRRDRQARILRQAFDVTWEYAPDAFGALLHELRLIKQHRPPLNVERVEDEWPRAYVALTAGAVPGLRILRRTDDPRGEAVFGPFRAVQKLVEAVRTLAEITGVRDCSLEEPGSGRAPGCLRVELGSCPGPCVGGGHEESYREGVAAARAFLDGISDAPLRLARQRMRSAAASLEFERAAAWRDRADRLAWLFGRLRSFQASMDRLTFRYVVPTPEGHHLYLLRRGTVRAALRAPRTAEEEAALETLARRIYLEADARGRDVPLHDLEEFYVVASWFRRNPGELARTTAPMPT